MSSKENYPNKSTDFTQTCHQTKHQDLQWIQLHHCTKVYSQHVGATGDREL